MAVNRRLSRLLVLSHVGLALALWVLMLAIGAGSLRGVLSERAELQTTRAAADALSRIEDQRRDVAMVARLLAERPTLQGHLLRGRPDRAAEFLDTFRETAQVHYIQIDQDGETVLASGQAPPQRGRAGLQRDGTAALWMVQDYMMLAPLDVRVRVGRQIALEQLQADQAGGSRIEVLTLQGDDWTARPADGDVALERSLRHVATSGVAESVVATQLDERVRIEPIRTAAGEVEALLLATLPGAAVARDGVRWLTAFALTGLLLAAVAALVAVWLARRIARPFDQLAKSAERLGVGNLETPVAVPATDLAEPLALARSLEAMRRQVRVLADTERAQRHELDVVLDGVGDGIIAIDDEGIVRYANRQLLQLVERDAQAVVGKHYRDFLFAGRGDTSAAAGPDPLLSARERGTAEAVIRTLIGAEARNLVVRSTAPMGGRQVAIVREETIEEAVRTMRDAIVANLSHEFQTPLAAQMASVEMLRDRLRASGDSDAILLVESQYRGALRLSQLVDNMLDSARLESGEMRLRDEPVDLGAVAADAIDLMRPLLAQRDQNVIANLTSSDRSLRGDPQRLSQVVVNLLANANKFSPDQSTIRVELVWGEATASLWVEDEGPGLPPMRSRNDLFAPFRRAPEEEPAQRGTGLGLAIARALVERHGGELVVAEPRHGRGARFGMVLRLESP